jgi:hypothetical protein
MRAAQIGHVDVIPNTTPIGGREIVAKDLQRAVLGRTALAHAHRLGQNQGDQMRFGFVPLATSPRRIATRRIEVAQADASQ